MKFDDFQINAVFGVIDCDFGFFLASARVCSGNNVETANSLLAIISSVLLR